MQEVGIPTWADGRKRDVSAYLSFSVIRLARHLNIYRNKQEVKKFIMLPKKISRKLENNKETLNLTHKPNLILNN